MKYLRISIFISLSVLLVSCDRNSIIGEWNHYGKTILEFKKDNTFTWENKNSDFDFFGEFRTSKNNDSLILTTKNFDLKFRYIMFDNCLVIWNNKSETGKLKHHIDEVFLFNTSTNSCRTKKKKSIKEVFILPKNFIGQVYVNYTNISNKIKFEERTITIPQTGLIKTTLQVSILNFAFSNYRFEMPNGKQYNFFVDDITSQTQLNKLDRDSIYVCVYGFNQEGRPKINKIFNEEISGNVLMFEVDTLKNLIPKMKKY